MPNERGNEAELLRYLSALRGRVAQAQHAGGQVGKSNEKESEQIFRAIFENAADGILLVDLESRKFYMGNRVACQMLGYGQQELKRLEVVDIHQKEDLPFVTEQFARQVREELTLARDIPVKRKDGSVFHADINAFPITFGQKTYLMGIFRDITRRRNAEEELKKSEEQFRGIFEHTAVGVYRTTPDGRILMANPALVRMLGYSSFEELARRNLEEEGYEPQYPRGVFKEKIEKAGEVKGLESAWVRRDGTILTIIENARAVRDEHGNTLYYEGTAEDISHRKEVERALAQSEEKYRTLVESSADVICIIDGRGAFLFANRKAAEVIGVQREELVGKTMWDFFPKEVADRRIAAVRQVIESKQDMSIVRQTELRGQLFWYHTKLVPVGDGHGGTVVMAISRDVGDIKQAEERIRTLSSAVEQSTDGIAMGDLEQRLRYVNAAYARMHGYPPEEMIGMHVLDVRNKEKTDEHGQIVRQIGVQGSWTGETEHVRKDGSIFPCYLSVTSLKDDQGQTTGRITVCRDITEARAREKELTRHREQMTRAERLASLGTLSATIAHQVTQPLTVIRLSLDNVLDELEGTSCSSTVLRRLRDSVAQVSNITSIVNRFRSFARQSSDTGFGEVNVYVVAARVARLLAESARQARLTLRVEDMGKLPCVFLNEREFEQIFFALIENAIQAADGKKERQLVIGGVMKDEQIELRFCDTCGGIAPEHLERIFQPFFTTKPRGRGTGLGLCIVQDAVERFGGRVRIESQWGQGSTFFVTLPVNQE